MFTAKRYQDAANAVFSMLSPPDEARYILIAALGQLDRVDDAKRVREDLFASAQQDMPDFPGERLQDWVPIFERMLGKTDQDLQHLLDSLELSGWN